MPTPEFLQLLVVAVVAGYVGYLLGRASARPSIDRPRHAVAPAGSRDGARRTKPPLSCAPTRWRWRTGRHPGPHSTPAVVRPAPCCRRPPETRRLNTQRILNIVRMTPSGRRDT